ncbi:MAG: hypothetical protein IJV80_00195 [Clostridia bacterium]|nr:hypothetical protein [Clostridia bacterium]
METNKIRAYLGFCIRSGKIVYGVDGIAEHRKKAHLVMADGDLSENSLKALCKERERFGCPMIVTQKGLLGELLCKPAVKAVAIREKNLALAIISAAEGNPQFNFYSGGNN